MSIQSVISQFINFRISPKIGHPTFFSSRRRGGLGILNPKLQQGALQLRWLDPLLSMSTTQLLAHPPPSLSPPYNPAIRPSWSTFWFLLLSRSCRHLAILRHIRLNRQTISCSPVKLAVWQQVHRGHLGGRGVHRFITFCSPHARSASDLCFIAATTLESIWSFILNDTPFTTDLVLALVAQKIRQSQQEFFLAAGIPPLTSSFLLH
ncbi:hypothetical protein MUCCIDRAFT_107234 [Mucor lusitanicus CBS 277.49]|uniref:Uncharacterized protein n=1 Tax=Mucor lusitanicus CBS 277.49 TaxID=747725 RepID=A0A168NS19_MUCCL|nr:hypothetical protein MUCCIDRAFT_107234 [Mucor lusitanicus CBS 277.49]